MMRKKIGRPKGISNKVPISIRLDKDILDYYRSSGPGWMGRINDDLSKYITDETNNRVSEEEKNDIVTYPTNPEEVKQFINQASRKGLAEYIVEKIKGEDCIFVIEKETALRMSGRDRLTHGFLSGLSSELVKLGYRLLWYFEGEVFTKMKVSPINGLFYEDLYARDVIWTKEGKVKTFKTEEHP